MYIRLELQKWTRYRIFAAIFLVFLISYLHADPIPLSVELKKHKKPQLNYQLQTPEFNYPYNPHISEDVWNTVRPYLLPSNHPIKGILDTLFGQKRVTQSLDSLQQAGFPRCSIRTYSQLVVTYHPALPGYWLKFMVDEQHKTDYPILIHRIQGAELIRNYIHTHEFEHIFKVPRKWLYPLPPEPSPPPGHHRQNFILVAEDMNIYHKSKNEARWKTNITLPTAIAIYITMQELGLNDCIYPFNLPFCKDGKLAFIDTEHFHNWPVRFDILGRYMPPTLMGEWNKIIQTNGRP